MKAKNPPDAMKCAECDRPLLWQGAVCGHCEAKFAQELAEENYRRLLAVQAGKQGQHTCPVCSLCFDQPNIAPTLPAGLPWYLRWNAQGCPHCNTLLEWQPTFKIDYFLGSSAFLNPGLGILLGQLAREYVFDSNAYLWQCTAFVILLTLWFLSFANDRTHKGSWVVKTQINTTHLVAKASYALFVIAVFTALLLLEMSSFAGFICFVASLIFIAAITATNLILWKRDYVHRRSVSPSPSS